MSTSTPDVVIVGAGVSGCAIAIALKRIAADLDICILDRGQQTTRDTNANDTTYADHIRPKIGETLPPQVIIPLQQLGIWEQFLAASFLTSAGTSSAWGTSTPYANEHIYSPYGNGWHLDRKKFDALLLNAAIDHEVRVLDHAQFLSINQQQNGWQIEFRKTEQSNALHQHLSAKFVVDATGRSARVAQRIGANKQFVDHLLGIYRFYYQDDKKLQHELAADSSTLIESARNGWWYSARLPGHKQVVALMTDTDIAQAKGYGHSIGFDQALEATQQIGRQLDGMAACSAPVVSAAHTQHLDRMAGKSWLAVGDAAFTFDPLSSLGIFKALRMSLYASYAIKDFFNDKDQNLIKYQTVAGAEFNSYLAKRREYYAEESRFSNNPFWARRLAA